MTHVQTEATPRAPRRGVATAMTGRVGDYALCGLRLRSDLRLPELGAWGANDRAPDIVVRMGPIPVALADVAARDAHGDVAADGAVLVAEPGVARYLVRGGREVIVRTLIDPASPRPRAILHATVFGVLCHQRGWLPLHASSCVVGGRALLFAGARGSGKSALATVLARRGHALLADDVTPVSWPPRGPPLALPAVACPRLSETMLRALGVPLTGALAPAFGKRGVPGLARAASEPVPVGWIVHLIRDPRADAPSLMPWPRRDALGPLYDACFRGGLARAIGVGGRAFQAVARLASACPSFRLVWNGEARALDRMADWALAVAHAPALVETK